MHRVPLADASKGRKRRLARPVRIALGVLLLLGGIAGLVLPVLQGVLMIMAALAVLRQDIPCVACLWDRHLVPHWEHWGARRWERGQEWFRRTVQRKE
ncbi:MAG TPA: hypothetical protein VIH59_33575 [Candidatus Tectomicrobia bacterium]|jgi:hypothetical protein